MKDTKTKWLLIATLISIMVSILFYYYIRNLSHPPDYGYHSVMSILFKENPRSIFIWSYEQLDFICKNHNIARISPVITSPSLYANITGKALFLIDLFLKNQKLSLKIVELLQVSFGLINLYYIYKISGFVFKKEFPRIMSILLVSNLQMFSYMMSHLNYDNLVNLASTLSIYYLLHYMKKRDMKDVFKLLLWICVGCLTKFTFGPLLILILLVFIFNERKRVKEILKDTKVFLFKKKNIVLTSLTTIFTILTAVFYGNNILTYKTILPSPKQGKEEVAYCKALLPVEEEELNVSDQEESSSLEESDKEVEIEEEPEQVGIFKYLVIWLDLMVERLINIASHKSLYKPRIYTVIFEIIFLLSGVLFLVKYRFKNKYINVLLFLFCGYLGYLFMYKYKSYLVSNNPGSAVTGRYMFPVIGPFIILFVYGFWNIFKKKTIPIAILVILSIFFIYSDTVYLFQNYKIWSSRYMGRVGELVGPMYRGDSSPRQNFKIEKGFSNRKLAVHISTYGEKIEDGVIFNLYDGDCITKIESIKIKNIKDNCDKTIRFSNRLEYDKEYCFDVQNKGSDNPITLWYPLYDLEGYSTTVLFKETNVGSTVGPLYKGELSPKQVFYIDEGYSNTEIAVFASTYEKDIVGEFQFNLYDESCSEKIESVKIEKIWDNDYIIVKLKDFLEEEKHYCFDIENLKSDNPITLWYSNMDLNGWVLREEDKDIHFSQIKRIEDEKDLSYILIPQIINMYKD